VRSKREAEEYLRNSGLRWGIVRAPMVFCTIAVAGFRLLSRRTARPVVQPQAGAPL